MKQQNIQSDIFIKIYNCLLKEGDKKLSCSELNLYVALAKRKSNYDQRVLMTLSMITELTSFSVSTTNGTTNNNKSKKVLLGLHEKKVITINNLDTVFKANTVIDITVCQLDYTGGYLKGVPQLIDVEYKDEYELYAVCFIAHTKKKQVEQSIEGWGTILSCGYDRADDTLKQLCERQVVYRKEGVKLVKNNGSNRNLPATYSLTPFEGMDTKSNTKSPTVILNASTVSLNPSETHVDDESNVNVDDATNTITVDDTVTSTSPDTSVETRVSPVDGNSVSEDILVAESIDYGNWAVYGANLTDKDYDLHALYYKVDDKDDKFTEKVEWKLNLISKNKTNEDSVKSYERNVQAAKDRLADKVRKDKYALVDKHREMVISKHLTGKYITIANKNRVEDECHMASMLIDDFAKLSVAELKKISDIYKFTEGEHGKYVDYAESFFNTMQYADEGLIGGHDVEYSDVIIKQIRDEIVNQMRSDKYAKDEYELDLYNLKKYKDSLIKPVAANRKSDKTVNETDISRHLDESSSVKDKAAAHDDGLPF